MQVGKAIANHNRSSSFAPPLLVLCILLWVVLLANVIVIRTGFFGEQSLVVRRSKTQRVWKLIHAEIFGSLFQGSIFSFGRRTPLLIVIKFFVIFRELQIEFFYRCL